MYLNNLQSNIFGGILILMICIVACEKSETDDSIIAFGQKVELKKTEVALYGKNINDGLKVAIDNIEDGRCPSSSVCIWAGEATVKLNIKSIEDSIKVSLKLSSNKESISNFTLNNNNYQAKLFSVNPYPNTLEPRNDLKVVISLIKI